jgi:chorismate mutase
MREQIDLLDKRILELLAARFKVANDVAAYKSKHDVPARIPSRIRAVIERREAAGRGLGLPRKAAANIWKVIVEETCRFEEGLIDDGHPSPRDEDSVRRKRRPARKAPGKQSALTQA